MYFGKGITIPGQSGDLPVNLALHYIEPSSSTHNFATVYFKSDVSESCVADKENVVNLKFVNKSTGVVTHEQITFNSDLSYIGFVNTPEGTYDVYQECYRTNNSIIANDYKVEKCMGKRIGVKLGHGNVVSTLTSPGTIQKVDVLSENNVAMFELAYLNTTYKTCNLYLDALNGYKISFEPANLNTKFKILSFCGAMRFMTLESDIMSILNNGVKSGKYPFKYCDITKLDGISVKCKKDEILKGFSFVFEGTIGNYTVEMNGFCVKAKFMMLHYTVSEETYFAPEYCMHHLRNIMPINAPTDKMFLNSITFSLTNDGQSLSKKFISVWASIELFD